MKLTIGIPNYNGGDNLVRAIKSCLNIGMLPEDYEILIIDNCSKDNSIKLVNGLMVNIKNIRLIENYKNCGRVGNWNKILNEAKGKNVLFLFSNDQISFKNNINQVIDIMIDKKIKISKSNKLNISTNFIVNNKIKIISLKLFLNYNFGLLSSLPFGPLQTFIFDLKYLKENNLRFNLNNEITSDHEFGLDIFKKSKEIDLLKTESFNILFDNKNKKRLHTKLSYFDMISSEFKLIIKDDNYKIVSDNKQFIIKKYLTRINYIFLLNKFSFGKIFINFKKNDKKKLHNLFLNIGLLNKKDFFYLNILSYLDFLSFIGFFQFIRNKGNSI